MTMVTPVFTTHFSLPSSGSLLTLEEPGKAKAGGPISVFDFAQQAGLKEVVIADDHIDGFIKAYSVSTRLGIKLCFGVKMVVCADGDIKDDASLATESKVIVFARDMEGYHRLVSIWNRAATRGFYYSARTSWVWLKEQWSDHLLLALPWASSFLARNTLTFNRIVPDLLPSSLWVFREVQSELPFAPLIDAAIDRFIKDNPGVMVVPMHAVYYKDRAAFAAYQVMRCIANRTSFNQPNVDHLSSDAFGFDTFLSLCPPPLPPQSASL